MHSQNRFRAGLLTPVLCLSLVLLLQSQVTNPRVDNFLNSLSTLANADAARAAFNTAKFSEAELRLLQNGLRDPRYSAPIQRLIKTVKAPPKALPAAVNDLQSLATEQTRKIGGVNQRLRTEAQSLLAVSAKLSSSAMRAIMGTAPKITSLSQATIEPGQQLIIRGTDLLPQGSVTFTFGSSSFNGAVVYWANDFILLTFPADVQGIGEMDGAVTVRKQNSLRADAAIRFIPIWQYKTITSNQLTYADNPYDGVVAFYLWLVKGVRDWCSQYHISYSVGTVLYHGYTIFRLGYIDDQGNPWGGDQGSYVGTTNLPIRTTEAICFYIFEEPELYCRITVKGPLGLNYER